VVGCIVRTTGLPLGPGAYRRLPAGPTSGGPDVAVGRLQQEERRRGFAHAVSVVRSIASSAFLGREDRGDPDARIAITQMRAAVDVASSCRDVVDSVSAMDALPSETGQPSSSRGKGMRSKREWAAEGTHGKSPEGEEEEGAGAWATPRHLNRCSVVKRSRIDLLDPAETNGCASWCVLSEAKASVGGETAAAQTRTRPPLFGKVPVRT